MLPERSDDEPSEPEPDELHAAAVRDAAASTAMSPVKARLDERTLILLER